MVCCWQELQASSLRQGLSHQTVRAVQQIPNVLQLLEFAAFMPIHESTAL
jgi:hypothetical protein